ncbi:MAG: ParB N-terminal domain-containing protein [Nitrososphaeria archaeon]
MKTWVECEYSYVPVEMVYPNSFNTNHMKAGEYEKLKSDLVQKGVEGFPPILVTPRGDKFMIVDGEHRWRAAVELGCLKIKAEIVHLNDEEAKVECFKRNYQRGWINYFKAAELFWKEKQNGMTIREIAEKYSLSTYTVDSIIRFSKFPPDLKELIVSVNDESEELSEQGFKFTFRHLVALSKLPVERMMDFAEWFQSDRISGPLAEKEVAVFLIKQHLLGVLDEKKREGVIFPKVAEMLKTIFQRNPALYSEEKIQALIDVGDEKRQETLAKRLFLEEMGERFSLYSIAPTINNKVPKNNSFFSFKCNCGRVYKVHGRIVDALEKWDTPPTKTIEIRPEHLGKKLYINYADMVYYFE